MIPHWETARFLAQKKQGTTKWVFANDKKGRGVSTVIVNIMVEKGAHPANPRRFNGGDSRCEGHQKENRARGKHTG